MAATLVEIPDYWTNFILQLIFLVNMIHMYTWVCGKNVLMNRLSLKTFYKEIQVFRCADLLCNSFLYYSVFENEKAESQFPERCT